MGKKQGNGKGKQRYSEVKETTSSPLDIFRNWDSKKVHKKVVENQRITVGAAIAQGPRDCMEDAYTVIPDLDNNSSFVAVYDGHSGSGAARFCAKHLHKYLLEDESYHKGRFFESFSNVFRKMDRLMRSESGVEELARLQSTPPVDCNMVSLYEEQDHGMGKLDVSAGKGGSGTTAVCVLIRDDRLVISHVGDSHCTLWNGTEAVFVTEDHKPSKPGELERATKAGGELFKGWIRLSDVDIEGTPVAAIGLQVTRSLGDIAFKRNIKLSEDEQVIIPVPEVLEVDLKGNACEFLVIASDGVSRDCVERICPSIHDWFEEGACTNREQLAYFCEEMQRASALVDNKTVVIVDLKHARCKRNRL